MVNHASGPEGKRAADWTAAEGDRDAAACYVTGTGAFLPGAPVGNDALAALLGPLSRAQLRIQREALSQNGIRQRHYALRPDGSFTHDNAAMAAEAARAALADAGLAGSEIGLLAAATSGGDLLAPGFASAVHGALGLPPLALLSLHSFCAGGMMALQAAHRAVAAGEAEHALVVASEFGSRFFRSGFFDPGPFDRDAEFLRWTLSDGAGALVLSRRPPADRPSLRLDWVDLVSYAGQHDTCMYAGGRAMGTEGLQAWGTAPTLRDAAEGGLFRLRQDLDLLGRMVPLAVGRYLQLLQAGRVDPDRLAAALCHVSSMVFHTRLHEALGQAGAALRPDQVFTNLAERGNTGSAAIFVMLDEYLRTRPQVAPGRQVLLAVPESGRFIASFARLTAAAPAAADATGVRTPSRAAPVAAAAQAVPGDAPLDRLRQALAAVWTEFELGLEQVPVIRKLHRGTLTVEEYRALLFDLRQQVIDGARWIARAASSLGPELVELRPLFLGHAAAEQQDFRLLEADYVACGGTTEGIRAGRKNVGSQALSAWMFHKAGEPNPVDLLGAMVVIEGLGQRVADRWRALLQRDLGLRDDQCSFLRHHGAADEEHVQALWDLAARLPLDDRMVAGIVTCAKVTARLYRLQLEELGNR